MLKWLPDNGNSKFLQKALKKLVIKFGLQDIY